MTEGEINSRLRKIRWIFAACVFLILCALLVPMLSYVGVFKPSAESGAAFFQNSSSLVIAICVVLDACLAWGYRILNPSFPDKFFDKAKSGYLPWLWILVIAAAILNIGAALLSGYGEILLACITNRLSSFLA